MWWKNLGKKVNPICLVGWDQVPFFSWPIELKFPSYNSPTQQCQRNGQTISWYNLQAFHLGVEGQTCASLGYSWGYHFGQGAANMGQTKNGQLLAFSHPAALPHHVHVPASPTYIGRSLPLQWHLLSLSLSRLTAPSTSSSHALPPPATCLSVSCLGALQRVTSQVASRAADSATRAFGNCDSLSVAVMLSKSHLEREREMPSLWVIRVQCTLGQLLVVMRLCCFDSSMEIPLSCRSAEIEAATSSSCCCKCFSRCEISRLQYCVQISVGCNLLGLTLGIRLGSHGVCNQKFLSILCECCTINVFQVASSYLFS